MADDASTPEYGADSIKVLKGLEAVRKRPGMYIGDTDDGSGLHHMIYEVVDNAIDEALAGHASEVRVTLYPDGSAEITDNGRGVPVDIHPTEGISAAEVIMTQLHAGGKFDQNSYKVSGGLHGVGVSVVNALSDWLELSIHGAAGKKLRGTFRRMARSVDSPARSGGRPARLKDDGAPYTGTEVRFLASLNDLFHDIEYDRVQDAGAPAPRTRLPQFRGPHPSAATNAMRRFRKSVNSTTRAASRPSSSISTAPAHAADQRAHHRARGTRRHLRRGRRCEWNGLAITRTSSAFTNNIPQKDGGTHMAGFRGALTRTITEVHRLPPASAKKEKVSLTGDDAREGLTCVLVGEGARSEVFVADEGQAGLLRGAPRRGKPRWLRRSFPSGSRRTRATPTRS